MNHHQNESVLAAVQDLVAGQSLEAACVNRPVGGGGRGHGTISVQVYALGSGVSMARQGGNLLGREGAFELEANGKLFVFDPVEAGQAYGFIAPVEGDIAAVGQQVEAVDQEDLGEVGLARVAHDGLCKKTAILSLPQGAGKTLLANALADRLGCTSVVDEWHSRMLLKPGALHLTNTLDLEA